MAEDTIVDGRQAYEEDYARAMSDLLSVLSTNMKHKRKNYGYS